MHSGRRPPIPVQSYNHHRNSTLTAHHDHTYPTPEKAEHKAPKTTAKQQLWPTIEPATTQ